MDIPEKISNLRLAAETAARLLREHELQSRTSIQKQEDLLSGSLAGFRVGSVPFLNAVPLTRGLEKEILFATPAKLAELLLQGRLEAALVSVSEVLLRGGYDILDGVAIASLGEVQSVFLAHRRPLQEVREVFCDPASLTSVNLLRVLLAERGLRPEFKTLPDYDLGALPDYTLLIGDEALKLQHARHNFEIWDLGTAWFEMTRLPFVYAVWALRRGVENRELRRVLREAKDFGMDVLDTIIKERQEFTYEFRKDYLSWHIHYHLGSDEKRAIRLFMDLLARHAGRPVFEPTFVA